VQDGRDQRLHVQALLGQYPGHCDGMRDVGLARFAGLAGMRRRADRPGTAQQLALWLGQVIGGPLEVAHVVRQLRLIEGRNGRQAQR
jgi:hypothetical protein